MGRQGAIELNIVPVAAVAAIMTIIVLVAGLGAIQGFDFAGVERHQEAQSVFRSLVSDIEDECRAIGNEAERVQLGEYEFGAIERITASGTILSAEGEDLDFTRQVTECSEVTICKWDDHETCDGYALEIPDAESVVIDYYKPHADAIKLMQDSDPAADDDGGG